MSITFAAIKVAGFGKKERLLPPRGADWWAEKWVVFLGAWLVVFWPPEKVQKDGNVSSTQQIFFDQSVVGYMDQAVALHHWLEWQLSDSVLVVPMITPSAGDFKASPAVFWENCDIRKFGYHLAFRNSKHPKNLRFEGWSWQFGGRNPYAEYGFGHQRWQAVPRVCVWAQSWRVAHQETPLSQKFWESLVSCIAGRTGHLG